MVKRTRVLFFAPGQPENAGNVWVDLDPQEPAATLLFDYGSDLHPAAGWEMDAGHVGRFEVRSAEKTADGKLRLALLKINGGAS